MQSSRKLDASRFGKVESGSLNSTDSLPMNQKSKALELFKLGIIQKYDTFKETIGKKTQDEMFNRTINSDNLSDFI